MSQKSILSFFKNAGTSSKEETKNKVVVVKDSPVKKVRNKRKVQCLESDDESSDQINKDTNGDSNKSPIVSKNGSSKSDSTSRNEPEKQNRIKENGTHSTEKPSKLMKTENGPEKIPSPSSKKDSESSVLDENSTKPSTSNVTNDSSNKTGETKETLDQNGIVDFIPKRKTARKQMSSAKNRRADQKVVKDQLEPKIDENGIDSDLPKANCSDSSPVKSSKDELLDEKEIKNDENDSSNKKSPRNSKKSVNLKSKASSKDPEKVNDCDTSPTMASNEEMPDQDKSENIGKNSKNKRLPKDTKKAVTSKSKAGLKEKNSPVKKSTKRESIHSFFAPLKAKEDKNTDEEEKTKRCHEETEDSPVKKPKRQKKAVIESDDEEEDIAESDSLVLVETNKTNDSTSSKAEDSITNSKDTDEITNSKDTDEITNSKDTDENEPKLSPKKTKAETPEKDEDKQKITVKSTSASNVYDPSKNNYHPIEDACWKHGEKVPYLALAKTLELIENTSGRLKTIEILSNFLRSVIVLSPDDMLQSVYLCLNRLAPEYCGIELGVGETLLMKAVAQATGRTVDKIKAEVAIKGDLGLVSESSRGNQRVMFAPPKLTVASVFQKFLEIAKMSGNASMAKKTDKIKVLFVACRDCEAKYIIRSLSGKLRIGLAEQSVLCAIARAAVLTPPGQTYPPEKIDASKGRSADSFKEFLDSQILILKTAYCECPNYDLIIPVILKEGISALPERCQLSPGVPLKPMLAHPTAGIDKVLERFDKHAFTCEFKYDGERAQIHMTEKGDVKIFSRNQEDNTSKYPDVISRLQKAVNETTKSFVLDSEAVAWDRESKQILPFQVLSTRKKKDAVESEITVQVCIMAFDLLYLNGESLVKKPLKERRSLLHSSFKEVENEFMFAQYKDGNSAETMQEFLDESVKGNCEGLMVKSLEVDASYEIAKRSHNWLKLKKDYLQGIGDTLDLVVIGGYYGKGKRTGNYGGFLLACYDDDNEEFQSICKLGTGFKDDNLEAHTKFLKQHIIKEPKSYFRYDHSLEPDEWFEPVQVWEIKCADLSISPIHKAAMGIVDPEKGISLRFPRFIRIREDKTPENATNSVQIADMYQKQQQIQNTANKNAKVEEDYY